jgi:hypothetical protein
MKTDVIASYKSIKQTNFERKKTHFLLASCQPLTKQAGSGSVPKCHGSTALLVAVQQFYWILLKPWELQMNQC